MQIANNQVAIRFPEVNQSKWHTYKNSFRDAGRWKTHVSIPLLHNTLSKRIRARERGGGGWMIGKRSPWERPKAPPLHRTAYYTFQSRSRRLVSGCGDCESAAFAENHRVSAPIRSFRSPWEKPAVFLEVLIECVEIFQGWVDLCWIAAQFGGICFGGRRF